VSLNIKNPETHALAAQIARKTGESMTEAVTVALRERLARLEQPDALAEDLLAIGKDCAARLKEPWRSIDHGALLYDDLGLPR
jgi:antitoxin VapB